MCPKNSGMLRVEPRAAGREARTLSTVLCGQKLTMLATRPTPPQPRIIIKLRKFHQEHQSRAFLPGESQLSSWNWHRELAQGRCCSAKLVGSASSWNRIESNIFTKDRSDSFSFLIGVCYQALRISFLQNRRKFTECVPTSNNFSSVGSQCFLPPWKEKHFWKSWDWTQIILL